MKAPDIVESWKWKSAEDIIERLLSESARSIGAPATSAQEAPQRTTKDRHYTAARRLKIRLAMKRAKRGGR